MLRSVFLPYRLNPVAPPNYGRGGARPSRIIGLRFVDVYGAKDGSYVINNNKPVTPGRRHERDREAFSSGCRHALWGIN
eukprot:4717043-Pleurochrysis_carterae.AAC.1